MQSIDRSLNDILHGPSGLPIKLTIDQPKRYPGQVLAEPPKQIGFFRESIGGSTD